jgi:hypothetical protein
MIAENESWLAEMIEEAAVFRGRHTEGVTSYLYQARTIKA